MNATQAHVDAELKQVVLRVFRQMIGKRDDGWVFVFRERLELTARLGQDLPAARAWTGDVRREPCFVGRKLRDDVVEMVRRTWGIAVLQARRTQSVQHRLDMLEPPWPDRRRVGEDTRRVTMRE